MPLSIRGPGLALVLAGLALCVVLSGPSALRPVALLNDAVWGAAAAGRAVPIEPTQEAAAEAFAPEFLPYLRYKNYVERVLAAKQAALRSERDGLASKVFQAAADADRSRQAWLDDYYARKISAAFEQAAMPHSWDSGSTRSLAATELRRDRQAKAVKDPSGPLDSARGTVGWQPDHEDDEPLRSAAVTLGSTLHTSSDKQTPRRNGPAVGGSLMIQGWRDGMFPSRASFPADYHFGSDNVFGEQSSFGAGDTFGDNNVFGKGSTFGAGVSFGDKNAFGKKESFGPGSKFGSYETVGAGSTFQDGTVIGKDNQFGREVEFGRRVSLGRSNQFGFDDAFGYQDQMGARNQFGRGTLFGDKIMFGKNQEFGARNTFASPEFLVGNDQFGHRNWGLDPKDLPANDVNAWNAMVAKYPDFIPERDARDRVLTLHQQVENKELKATKKARAHILPYASSGRLISSKSKRTRDRQNSRKA